MFLQSLYTLRHRHLQLNQEKTGKTKKNNYSDLHSTLILHSIFLIHYNM